MRQVDLVVEPKNLDGDSVVCCYYFANHRDRCLFCPSHGLPLKHNIGNIGITFLACAQLHKTLSMKLRIC
ncbi:uncharacterized protein BJ212DRAFT_1403404 [Suillus subaureus]|uniref:Uncharacterized protein n=1 Tax=Suillus subaureus TaxID=48587 RepID=A0A9P7J1A0_9AGAM|nr:uncharacterized protein BJ212DRAFT_1403404 [Suillus subaureus]KAG1798697.1 hypothetical protein BJ212DRAFT_1403404 [Suillus subaureus]